MTIGFEDGCQNGVVGVGGNRVGRKFYGGRLPGRLGVRDWAQGEVQGKTETELTPGPESYRR